MRMKRPQGYKHIKCPHCGEKIRIRFKTLHRMKMEVEEVESSWVKTVIGDLDAIDREAEEGG